jgi:hypothetical protein
MRPRKFAIKLVLFLLLGAIINVAVAWSSCVWIDPFRLDPEVTYAGIDAVYKCSPFAGQHYTIHAVSGFGFRPRDHTLRELLPDWVEDESLHSFMLRIHDGRGWPCVALYAALEAEQTVRYSFDSYHAIETPLSPWSSGGNKIPRVLPLRPVWPGFAINTIFYAGVLWFIFAIPGGVKRLRRRAKGWCIHCGYDLRGAPHERCPECGKAIMARNAVHGAAAPPGLGKNGNPRNESNA